MASAAKIHRASLHIGKALEGLSFSIAVRGMDINLEMILRAEGGRAAAYTPVSSDYFVCLSYTILLIPTSDEFNNRLYGPRHTKFLWLADGR